MALRTRRVERVWAKPLDGDAHRHAGGAGAAGRTVGEAMAAAEAGARQRVVKAGSRASGEFDDQLAFGPARDVGAGNGGGGEELVEGAEMAKRLAAGRSRGRLRARPIAPRPRTARPDFHAFRSPSRRRLPPFAYVALHWGARQPPGC